MDDDAPQLDPRKIRLGLAIVTAIVVVALILLVIVDDPIGKAVMAGVAAVGVVRAFLLRRSLRADPSP